jgi:large subunit ribosomal protein L24
VALKIRRGDTVEVMSGKDSGKQGRVLRVEPKKNRLFVEGLNIVKRHQRPRSLKDTQRGGKVGGVIEKEGPIHVSNVMVVDPKQNKPTRVGIERTAESGRERVAKRSNTKLAN